MKHTFAKSIFAFALILNAVTLAYAQKLPTGFVHLRAVSPDIIQDMRYATRKNFVGRVLSGYEADECILAKPVALALHQVQLELAQTGHSLVVFDCYRPNRAVRMMVQTLQRKPEPDPTYYPRIKGIDLVKYGYVASRSGHSSGGSVDLTVARITANGYRRADMGTEFDFFDPKSHTKTGKVTAAQKRNRAKLSILMRKHGFSGYANEWWHFRYVNEPFRGRYFDFPITAYED